MNRRRPQLIGGGLTPSFVFGTENPAASSRIKGRHFVSASIFIVLSTAFCFYFVAFPLTDLTFTNTYPRFGTPPSPNEFRSARYTWGWVFIYILTALNLMLPYLLAQAVVNNTSPEYAKIHYFVTRATTFLSGVAFVGLSVAWLFFCNTGFADYTYCHDKRWCCVQYASSVEASKWCPNNTPCVPNVTGSELVRSDPFFQVWLFSLLFSFWALVHREVHKDLKGYGLFREVFTEEEVGAYE